jgi:cytosine/uracil/thiamine/allantoin permease
MMVDYYFVRHRRVVIEDLFRDSPSGAYYYRRGVNPRALWVFVPTAAISVFIALGPSLPLAAPFSWFIGAGLAAVAYYFAMRNHPSLAREGVTDVRRAGSRPDSGGEAGTRQDQARPHG